MQKNQFGHKTGKVISIMISSDFKKEKIQTKLHKSFYKKLQLKTVTNKTTNFLYRSHMEYFVH